MLNFTQISDVLENSLLYNMYQTSEGTGSFKTSLTIYQSTQRNIPEDLNFQELIILQLGVTKLLFKLENVSWGFIRLYFLNCYFYSEILG